MKHFLKHNLVELVLFVFFIGSSFYFIRFYPKNDIHLYLNQYVGNPVVDQFFYYITYLGDGLVAVFLLIAILFYNLRLGIYVTTSFLTASFVSIGLKRLFFDDENRPLYIFSYISKHTLKLVDGVHVYIHNSFPSGHATQAFAIFMCLVFSSKNQALKFIFFMLALFASLSRVYLSQHWLIDITVGSCIGFLFSLIYYFLFIQNNTLQKLNVSIFNLKKP